MPTFETYEDTILASLKTIAGVSNVAEFTGDLSADALKRIAPRDAGLIFIPLGGSLSSEQPSTGQLSFSCKNAVFVVTRNARGSSVRSRAARVLAHNVMLHVWKNSWALSGVYPAVIKRLENRSSGGADDAGFAIWTVIFEQVIYLDAQLVEPDLAPANLLIRQTPLIGAANIADYHPVGGA